MLELERTIMLAHILLLNNLILGERSCYSRFRDFFYILCSDCCIHFHVLNAQSLTVALAFRLVTPSGFRVNQSRFKVACYLSDCKIIGPKFPVVVIDIVYSCVKLLDIRTVDESVLRPFAKYLTEDGELFLRRNMVANPLTRYPVAIWINIKISEDLFYVQKAN